MSAVDLLAPSSLIALFPLAAAIILLYLLKLRRRDQVVPSVFLWRRAVQDVQANAPFQRLRRNLLLLLQLLALSLIVLGLAAPFVMASRLSGKSSVIVLDASASMSAKDAAGTRFAQAQRQAIEILRGMGRRDEAALVVCGARAQVAVPFSRDTSRLLSAVRDTRPTDCVTNVRDGLLLALSLASKRPGARIYLISDGAFPAIPEASSSAEVHFVKVGERSDNVAILAFEAARPAAAREHQVFLRVRSFSSKPKRCVVSIYDEDEIVDAHEIELAAHAERAETYRIALGDPGLLRAELEVDDDLASDNVAYAFAGSGGAAAILLVTPGNLFLEQGLLALPGVQVHKTASLRAQDAAAAYRDYDVVIFDRVAPPAMPNVGAVMVIGEGAGRETAIPGKELETPSITTWQEQHPILRHVNLSAVQISKARALEPAPQAQVLARAGDRALIVAREAPELRVLCFGWDFLDSDLPLRVSFPVLLTNALAWLSEGGASGAPLRTRPGSVLRFTAPPDTRRADLVLPDGGRRELAVVDGQVTIAECDRVGVYRLSAGGRKWRWAADLRSPEESDLTPADELNLGGKTVRASAGPPKVEQRFWPALAGLALLVLLVEWHIYHRRY